MILNNVKNLMLGSRQASKVMQGSKLIWQSCQLPHEYKLLNYIQNGNVLAYNSNYSPIFSNYHLNTGIAWGDAERLVANISVESVLDIAANRPMAFSSKAGSQVSAPWATIISPQVSGLSLISKTYVNNVLDMRFTSSSELPIHYAGWSDLNWTGIYRLRKLEIYGADGNLLFYGIPALDKNDVPCIYDSVSQKPKYNEGVGTYIYELA